MVMVVQTRMKLSERGSSYGLFILAFGEEMKGANYRNGGRGVGGGGGVGN